MYSGPNVWTDLIASLVRQRYPTHFWRFYINFNSFTRNNLTKIENNWDEAYKEYLWKFISRIPDLRFLIVNSKKQKEASVLVEPEFKP